MQHIRTFVLGAVVSVALAVPPALSAEPALDPYELDCSFVLADRKAAENPFSAAMELAVVLYWVVGFMNGQAFEDDSGKFIRFTERNSEAVWKAVEAACKEDPNNSLVDATVRGRESLVSSGSVFLRQ